MLVVPSHKSEDCITALNDKTVDLMLLKNCVLVVMLVKSMLCNEQEQATQQHEQRQQLQTALATSPVLQPVAHDPHSYSHLNPYWEHLKHIRTSLITSSKNAPDNPVLDQDETQRYTEATEMNSNGNQAFSDKTNIERKEQSHLMGYYHQPPALFDHHVLHLEPYTPQPFEYETHKKHFMDSFAPKSIDSERNDFDYHGVDNDRGKKSIIRKPKYDDNDEDDDGDADDADYSESKAATSKEDNSYRNRDQPVHETRSFHDIYMRVAGPNDRNLFGHVEHGPDLFERRFQSQDKGNRFRGEVLWADKTGGYGAHYWDLAQGKL